MVRIAITGGIACGKSLVGRILAEEGVDVCEADEIAHEHLRPGQSAFKAVVERFGREILAPDGTLDRARLGQRVFASSGELKDLNAIVHPGVIRAWQAWLEARKDRTACAVIVPLLFETGTDRGWDAIVAVTAPAPEQMRRLVGKGYSAADARRRIAAQMPVPDKSVRSDFVIFNVGTWEVARDQVRRVMAHILENSYGIEQH